MKLKASKKFLGALALILIVLACLALIAYSRWLYRIEQGNRALLERDYAAAASIYRQAAEPLQKYAPLRRLLKSHYRRLVFDRARAMYAQELHDELLAVLEEEARRAPFLNEDPEYHFLTGNIMFRRALAKKNNNEALEEMKLVSEIYRRALAADPESWDAKYNYELVRYILTRNEKDKQKKEQIKVLLEQIRTDMQQRRRELPPEKRG